MLRSAGVTSPDLAETVDAAACFHDLGKLDPDTQAALRKGRDAVLRWDHVDAGVAHLSKRGNLAAAWLVRAHHAPGLPSHAAHFTDPYDRKLRGRRRDESDPACHAEQIARTDARLADYLAAHEAAVGPSPAGSGRSCHGLALRLALSCLVDADHTDSASFERDCPPVEVLMPRWAERLERLDAYVAALPPSGSAERHRNRQAFYVACRDADVGGAEIVACEGPVGVGKTTAVTAYLLRRAVQEGSRRLFVGICSTWVECGLPA
jgi:CRISPR-associated endonuclease/helicase Cas3